MACSIPISLLIHRRIADGTEALLMARDLATAFADIADAGDLWTAERLTLGSEIILEGEALKAAVSASRARAAA